MTVVDHNEPIAIDALIVDVQPIEALIVDVHAIDAHVPEALVVEVRETRDVAAVAPVATGRGGALAQPRPEPVELEIAEPGDTGGDRPARPDLRVAPEGYRRRRRARIAAAAAAVSISVTLFAVVAFNVVLAQNQIELQSLQEKLQIEETRYYELRNEVAQNSSPQTIVAKATAFGLTVQQPGYLSVEGIKPPPAGPTETDTALRNASQNTGGIFDNPVP
jgi:hypothetical protein